MHHPTLTQYRRGCISKTISHERIGDKQFHKANINTLATNIQVDGSIIYNIYVAHLAYSVNENRMFESISKNKLA